MAKQRSWLRGCVVAATVVGASGLVGTPALADPAPDVARVVTSTPFNEFRDRLTVHSPSMGRDITVDIQRPKNASGTRPTLYMLDGAEAHGDQSGWNALTDLESLAKSENVNVVLPVGGGHTYYTDWKTVDPVMGKVAYETFLTRELPPLIDSQFGGNGANAIAGASMGGVAALTLTARHPDLYRGVASYSNCADITNPINQQIIQWDVARGGGNVINMWGNMTDPAWAEHDPQHLADKLRGKQIYVSSGNGVPGRYNAVLGDPPVETVEGIVSEFGAMVCTQQFGETLSSLKIPVSSNIRVTGTHKWGYWKDELHASWPMLMGSLGLR